MEVMIPKKRELTSRTHSTLLMRMMTTILIMVRLNFSSPWCLKIMMRRCLFVIMVKKFRWTGSTMAKRTVEMEAMKILRQMKICKIPMNFQYPLILLTTGLAATRNM